jgi:hypothetical protein
LQPGQNCLAQHLERDVLIAHCPCGWKRVESRYRDFRVSTIFRASHGGRTIAWPAWLLFVGMLISLRHFAAAHDLFADYVQHGVRLAVGARYTDIEVDLTFFERWSAHERATMDADANGRITRSEVESYVKNLAPELARQVKLRVAGQELALVPLYAPEVDLLGNDQVGPAHHRLRLFFFAPTPTTLHADDEIVVEDRLWPAAKALGMLQAEGRDDCTLETGKAGDPGFGPARAGEARLLKVRCLKPPKTQVGRATSSPASANPTASQHPSD